MEVAFQKLEEETRKRDMEINEDNVCENLVGGENQILEKWRLDDLRWCQILNTWRPL